MKYYAVKKGKTVGLFDNWSECEAQVKGYKDAMYKSFNNKEDALLYLNGEEKAVITSNPIAYVDGSYKESTGEYSFGCVLILDGLEYTFNRKFDNDDLSSMRNVAGEIKGAGFIIQYLVNRGYSGVDLYYDYLGIEKWYTKAWKANLVGTQKYVAFADSVRNKIQVNFFKVKGHSNDKYNDMADRLAKDVLGIK